MELKFTPRTIKELEDRTRVPFTETLSRFSVQTVALFVEKGLNVEENTALNKIEEALKGGQDITSIYIDIMEKLQADGFLPKALNLKELRAKMDNPKELKRVIDSSQNIGQNTNG